MTLQELQEAWGQDVDLPWHQPDQVIRDAPLHHSKWWNIYNEEKKRYILYKNDLAALKLAKLEWYTGRMSDEERTKRGWPVQPLRLVRTEVDAYIAADEALRPLQEKFELQQLKLDFIEDCIKSINFRNQSVKNWLEWQRFSNGG